MTFFLWKLADCTRETFQFIGTVSEQYQRPVEMLYSDPAGVQTLVKEKGLFSFYRDHHNECCGGRKVAPLRSKLAKPDAWVTGQRQDQSITRGDIPLREEYTNSPDSSAKRRPSALIKFNPLSEWTSAHIWTYMRKHEVPHNAIYDQGFYP